MSYFFFYEKTPIKCFLFCIVSLMQRDARLHKSMGIGWLTPCKDTCRTKDGEKGDAQFGNRMST